MLNVQQAAEKLGLAQGTIRRFIREGRIKAVKVGRDWRIKESEIERILEEGTK